MSVLVPTFFDYNGVLVNDEHVHHAAYRDVLSPLGIDLPWERYVADYLGYDDAGAFRAILRDAGRAAPSDVEVADLVQRKRPCYRSRALAGLLLFDGAPALVRLCAGRGPVGIVSGALRDEIEFGLERLGVAKDVSFIVSAEDTRSGKPDPEGYRLAVDILERATPFVQARLAVVVEDSLAGVAAAKAAGLACIGVAHSYAEQALSDAGADIVVARLSEIRPETFENAALHFGVQRGARRGG